MEVISEVGLEMLETRITDVIFALVPMFNRIGLSWYDCRQLLVLGHYGA